MSSSSIRPSYKAPIAVLSAVAIASEITRFQGRLLFPGESLVDKERYWFVKVKYRPGKEANSGESEEAKADPKVKETEESMAKAWKIVDAHRNNDHERLKRELGSAEGEFWKAFKVKWGSKWPLRPLRIRSIAN